MLARALLSASLLAVVALCAAPTAAADDVIDRTVLGHHVTACVIGVKGSCDPYNGHLVRVTVDGEEHYVPDPCYTTSCF